MSDVDEDGVDDEIDMLIDQHSEMVTDLYRQPDFEVLLETEGLEVAVPYAAALNCFQMLAESGHEDWIIELIRSARDELSDHWLKKLEETGM